MLKVCLYWQCCAGWSRWRVLVSEVCLTTSEYGMRTREVFLVASPLSEGSTASKTMNSDLTMQNSLKVSASVPHVIHVSIMSIYGRIVRHHRGYSTSSSPAPDTPSKSHCSSPAHRQSNSREEHYTGYKGQEYESASLSLSSLPSLPLTCLGVGGVIC